MMQIGMPKDSLVLDTPPVRPKSSSARFDHHLNEGRTSPADNSREWPHDDASAKNVSLADARVGSATASTGIVAPSVQAMLLQANGARIFVQSLRVVGYLSMAGVHGEGGSAGAHESAEANDQTDADHAIHGATPARAYRESMISMGASTNAILGAGRMAMQQSADGEDDPVAPSAPQAAVAADQPWARQLIRMSHKGEDATIWLRDFRLAPGSAVATVAALLKEFQNGSASIRTVMVNGHRAWQSSQAPGTLPSGDTP